MANRLTDQTSPYLLQHAENPVDWYPWGDEALERSRAESKPVFLSIGYSACHWCHVMAHESFEDPEIAELLNRHFVNVKVDREERPDIDQIYMEAVQIITGGGGWPLSVFLTPELEPFFGGTYWPPHSRGAMPGFDQIAAAVAQAWQQRRDEIAGQAARLTELIRNDPLTGVSDPEAVLDASLLDSAVSTLRRGFDRDHGGFGGAPKFPHAMDLKLLLRRWRRTGSAELLGMVTKTLDKMAAGGIYDHLGGGFHRYSVDVRWLVPHFEKMLYDNALLAGCYLEGWQATDDDRYRQVVRQTLDYVLRCMTHPGGGFYSTEDADSEGEEGKFYVWTPDEIRDVLGAERAEVFCQVYGVTQQGNFEGRSILHLARPIAAWAEQLGRDAAELEAELAADRSQLLESRQRRVRPGRDDKVLVSWNGLMIDAMAQAGAALDRSDYVEAAERAAEFVLSEMRDDRGNLLHSWRGRPAAIEAYLDDYAALAHALVTLYETDFQDRWIDEAIGLADEILRRFHDRDQGGFYMVAEGNHGLIARKKDLLDSSVPSGSGLAATALLRLGKLCGRGDYLEAAEAAIRAAVPVMRRAPTGAGQLLLALDLFLGPSPELVVLAGADREAAAEVLADLRRRFVPGKVLAYREPDSGDLEPAAGSALSGLFAGKEPAEAGPTLFVCENFSCGAPAAGKEAALATLDELEYGGSRARD